MSPNAEDRAGEAARMPTVHVEAEISRDELFRAVEQLSPPDFSQFLSQVLSLRARREAPSLSVAESQLLLRINQGIPDELGRRYGELIAKRQAETLTQEELEELLRCADHLEGLEASRITRWPPLPNLVQCPWGHSWPIWASPNRPMTEDRVPATLQDRGGKQGRLLRSRSIRRLRLPPALAFHGVQARTTCSTVMSAFFGASSMGWMDQGLGAAGGLQRLELGLELELEVGELLQGLVEVGLGRADVAALLHGPAGGLGGGWWPCPRSSW